MRKIGVWIIVLYFRANLFGQTTPAAEFASTITADELQVHLRVLASDAYEGRETGRQGQKLAAAYIRSMFTRFNIKPGANGEYYQTFPVELQYADGVTLSVNDSIFDFAQDFYYFKGFNDTVFTVSEVLFLGYGISEENYDDYGDRTVTGKTIVILDDEPKDAKGNYLLTGTDQRSAWSENWRTKLMEARKRGVGCLLIVTPTIQDDLIGMKHSISTPAMKLANGKKSGHKYVPNFHISPEMAKAMGVSNSVIDKYLKAKPGKRNETYTSHPAKVQVNVNRRIENLTAENVLGVIEGSDLKDEVVILTAHYDHIGKDGNEIYNGADDDGSGTVALLEIAQAFSKAKMQGKGPRRTVLIMPVSGEEKGLLGSQYYVENPVYPLNQTVADLNIDMIGRIDEKHKGHPNYVYIIGSDKLSSELHQINEDVNRKYMQLELDYTYNDPKDPNRYYYRSDHYNFAKNNIPVIFYFNGVHEDYHKPTDEVDKIDFRKLEKTTRLVFHTAWELANRTERIKVDKINDFQEK